MILKARLLNSLSNSETIDTLEEDASDYHQ